MYNVSERYLQNIWKNGREIEWYGTITTEDGETVYNFDYSNMVSDGFSITMQVSSEQIEIGSTGSAELKLGLRLTEVSGAYYLDGKVVDRYALYNSIVDINFRLWYGENDYEDVPMGTFIVAEPSRSKLVLNIDAFDNMVLFNTPIGTLGDGTPYDLLNYICLQCGVTFGNTEEEIEALTNGTEVLTPNEVSTVSTWRDAICQIAAILCGVAVIGRDSKLYIKQYSTTLTRQIDKSARYSYEVADFETFYTGAKTYDLINDQPLTVGNGRNGLVFDLGTNGFIQTDNPFSRLMAILNKLDDFQYTPFNATLIEDPSLDCLDVVAFTGDQASSSKLAAITSITYGFGAMEITCTGKNPKIKESPSSSSSTLNNLTQTKGTVRILSSTNTGDVEIADGDEEEVVRIRLVAGVQTSVVLSVDVKHTAVTTETVASDTYTNTDLVVVGKIYVGEDEQVYQPTQTEQDGVRTFHFTYPMILEPGGAQIIVTLTCGGGSLTVDPGDAQLSLIGSSLFNPRVESIAIEQTPYKYVQYVGDDADYTGLKVMATYQDGSVEDVTGACLITPAAGTPIADEGEFTVNVVFEE
jgi:hypothetical protein